MAKKEDFTIYTNEQLVDLFDLYCSNWVKEVNQRGSGKKSTCETHAEIRQELLRRLNGGTNEN